MAEQKHMVISKVGLKFGIVGGCDVEPASRQTAKERENLDLNNVVASASWHHVTDHFNQMTKRFL